MTDRPTLKNVAERVGVTVSTASLALRDDPRISALTKARIAEAALQIGYVYNRHAAGLRRGDSGTVAACLNDLSNPFFTEFVGAMESQLRAADRMVLFCNANEKPAIQADFMRRMAEHGAAGLILIPVAGTTRESLEQSTYLRHLPLVLLSRDVADAAFDRVINDDALGMRLVVNHLLDLGHRRIGWIGGGGQTSTAIAREQAFVKALQVAGIATDETLMVHGATSMALGDAGLAQLMDRPEPPTAVACFSDVIAFGVLSACHRMGLRVGHDLSVAGFDDMSAAAYATPALTSVRVRTDLMGARASELLLARMAGDRSEPHRAMIAPALVVRATTGPPR